MTFHRGSAVNISSSSSAPSFSSSSSVAAAAPMEDLAHTSAPGFERAQVARFQSLDPEFGDIVLAHQACA